MHNDYIGSLAGVIQAFDVGDVYMPKKSHTISAFEKLVDTISAKGLQLHTAKAGINLFNGNGLFIDMLAPISESYDDLNNYSAVVKITFNNTAFLFAGDAEAPVEQEMLRSGANLQA